MPIYAEKDFPLGQVQLRRTKPRMAVLLEDFQFVSPTLGLITVEKGFDTDYASIPRIFWSIYPPDGDYTEAAVVHDCLYWYQCYTNKNGKVVDLSRKDADTVILEAMTAIEIPFHRRHIIHKAVRLGGWVAWNKRSKQILESK